MSDVQTAPTTGSIDMNKMKRLYEVFQQGEPPKTLPTPPREGAMSKVMETLFNELVQIEKLVLEATKPSKPATLKGKFAYAESALTSTESRVTAFKTEDVTGAKARHRDEDV